MPVSIDSCPGCQAAILPDTVKCPSCGHVLKGESAPLSESVPTESGQSFGLVAAEMEDPCRNCGQMVRSGLLRCWNCNEFMRKDIAERFKQLQSAPQKIVYSETDREEYLPPREGEAPNPHQTFTAADADFDVNDGLPKIDQISKGGEFMLGDNVGLESVTEPAAPEPAQSPAAEAVPVADSGSFDLNVTQPAANAGSQATPPKEIPTVDPAAAPPADAEKTETAPTDAAASDAPTTNATTTEDAATTKPAAPAIPVPGEEDLFAVAMAEQKEQVVRRKARRKAKRKARGGIVVYCPRGHRIEVAMKFAGKRGKCPKCKSPFSVPVANDEEKAEAKDEVVDQKPTVPWLWDVKIHEVDPATLKLKPDSLVKAFTEVDLFFGEDGVYVTKLVALKKGRNASKKQKDAARDNVREHLENSLPLKSLPVGDIEIIKNDAMSIMVVVQPTLLPHESIFAGVPVFGEGRIAVRLTPTEDNKLRFLSFGLAKFREFAKRLSAIDGITNFGGGIGIPMVEEFETAKCHYSDDEVKSLADLQYYQADKTFELELVGRKCASCGISVSENYRKKEKLGGTSGRGIAKAKCPKCTAKFGNISLYSMQIPEPAEDAESETQSDGVDTGAANTNSPDESAAVAAAAFDLNDMDGAIGRARSETDQFIEQMSSGLGEQFGVKAAIEDDGKVEHLWLREIVYSDGQFEGLISDDPATVSNVKQGQKWTVSRDEISDWQFVREGKIHGNYTMRPLLKTMPAAEAEQFLSTLAQP